MQKEVRIPNSQGAPSGQKADKIIEMMKHLDLYKEGESRERQLEKVKNMSQLDFRELSSKLRLKKAEEQAREAGPHEDTWWFE